MPFDIRAAALRTTLQQLSQANGPSGQEAAVAALVKNLMASLCDEVQIDAFFTVVGLKRGYGPEPRPQMAWMAHLDEIFLLITAIEGPFLRFIPFGYDPRLLVGQEVVVLGRPAMGASLATGTSLYGVIGDRPPHLLTPHERNHMPRPDELVIDLGLDAETVATHVAVGDAALLRGPGSDDRFISLIGERVAGKALDNRLGVATMLAALDHLQEVRHPCDIIAIATSGEELNHLGARTSAFRIQPDLAIVIETTFGQQPGVDRDQCFPLGGGPVLGIGPNLHPVLTAKLADVAAELEMEHGFEPLPAHSGTDAWAVEITAGGIPCGLISLPLRNMHSPVEVADLKDAARAARWLAGLAAEVDHAFVASLAYKLPDELIADVPIAFAEATP